MDLFYSLILLVVAIIPVWIMLTQKKQEDNQKARRGKFTHPEIKLGVAIAILSLSSIAVLLALSQAIVHGRQRAGFYESSITASNIRALIYKEKTPSPARNSSTLQQITDISPFGVITPKGQELPSVETINWLLNLKPVQQETFSLLYEQFEPAQAIFLPVLRASMSVLLGGASGYALSLDHHGVDLISAALLGAAMSVKEFGESILHIVHSNEARAHNLEIHERMKRTISDPTNTEANFEKLLRDIPISSIRTLWF